LTGKLGPIPSKEEIAIDKEFAALIPPLSADELGQLEQSLLTYGCRDPLVVWNGKNILLDGHNRLSICRKHDLPFNVLAIEIADRDAAQAFIVKNQLGRRNLSPEAASYLRGKRYLVEKQSHGGDRSKARATDQSDRLETAKRLAAEYMVGEATIRRDGSFAAAVDKIAKVCGDKARQAILARDLGLSRGAVRRLAKMKEKDQQKAIQALLESGKLPRRSASKKKATITLPREPRSLAEKLLHSFGVKGILEVREALARVIKEQQESETPSKSHTERD
jgi:hypothetical protein